MAGDDLDVGLVERLVEQRRPPRGRRPARRPRTRSGSASMSMPTMRVSGRQARAPTTSPACVPALPEQCTIARGTTPSVTHCWPRSRRRSRHSPPHPAAWRRRRARRTVLRPCGLQPCSASVADGAVAIAVPRHVVQGGAEQAVEQRVAGAAVLGRGRRQRGRDRRRDGSRARASPPRPRPGAGCSIARRRPTPACRRRRAAPRAAHSRACAACCRRSPGRLQSSRLTHSLGTRSAPRDAPSVASSAPAASAGCRDRRGRSVPAPSGGDRRAGRGVMRGTARLSAAMSVARSQLMQKRPPGTISTLACGHFDCRSARCRP